MKVRTECGKAVEEKARKAARGLIVPGRKDPGALWEKRDPESLKQERIPQAKPVLQAAHGIDGAKDAGSF